MSYKLITEVVHQEFNSHIPFTLGYIQKYADIDDRVFTGMNDPEESESYGEVGYTYHLRIERDRWETDEEKEERIKREKEQSKEYVRNWMFQYLKLKVKLYNEKAQFPELCPFCNNESIDFVDFEYNGNSVMPYFVCKVCGEEYHDIRFK